MDSSTGERGRTALPVVLLSAMWALPELAFAQASPFLTGANALQTNILAWLTPIAIILIMVLGGMAMANRMLKSLAARIVFAAKDHADAREISDELGYTTVRAKTISTPLFGFSGNKGQRARSQNVSEQRRALLLPQEVKELGAEEAIIFYEGLRPIRARKIRYYQDRRFTARLLPPPERAAPAPPSSSETLVTAKPQFETPPASAPPADWKPRETPVARPATREATVADIDRLETLTLEDFAVDFDRVKIPQKAEGERLSSEELNAAVESFLDTLKTR